MFIPTRLPVLIAKSFISFKFDSASSLSSIQATANKIFEIMNRRKKSIIKSVVEVSLLSFICECPSCLCILTVFFPISLYWLYAKSIIKTIVFFYDWFYDRFQSYRNLIHEGKKILSIFFRGCVQHWGNSWRKQQFSYKIDNRWRKLRAWN